MRLIIRDDADQASAYVADYIVARINAFVPTPAHPCFVLGLPTGATPLGVYKILVDKYKAGEISFQNVITFNMDEYIGIPRDHPSSYHTFMWDNLFRHIDIPPANTHLPTAATATGAYEALIHAAGGIDLFLAGASASGHLAFNEPGFAAPRTRVVALAPDTRAANARFFAGSGSGSAPGGAAAAAVVPTHAVTVGLQTILDARDVVALVLGAAKARALRAAVERAVCHMCPLSSLQLHARAAVVCDADATLELKVKTVRYFKYMESVAATTPTTNPDVVVDEVKAPSPTTAASATSLLLLRPSDNNESVLQQQQQQQQQRSVSPDLVPDRMADRMPEPGSAARRLTPNPEAQMARHVGVY